MADTLRVEWGLRVRNVPLMGPEYYLKDPNNCGMFENHEKLGYRDHDGDDKKKLRWPLRNSKKSKQNVLMKELSCKDTSKGWDIQRGRGDVK